MGFLLRILTPPTSYALQVLNCSGEYFRSTSSSSKVIRSPLLPAVDVLGFEAGVAPFFLAGFFLGGIEEDVEEMVEVVGERGDGSGCCED